MLRSLQIRNYVLIDSLEIQFPAGLVIITGQTGAGKSILLGALSMLLGGKTDASMIGGAGDHCVVEGVFDVAGDRSLQLQAEEAGLDWNGGELTIRRVLSASGRSRAFVNDEPVNLSVLTALSGRLVDIHSQHQTLILRDSRFQLSLLDYFAGNGDLLEACASLWRERSALRTRLDDVRARLRRMAADRDYNEARYQQLADAGLREGELEALEAEQRQLANAEEIKGGLYLLTELFAPDEGSTADSRLKEAVRSLEKVGRFLPAATDLAARTESVRLELDDILAESQQLAEGIQLSPQRLEAVEERMSLLYSLFKKFGCSTVEELIAAREELSGLLYDSTALENEKTGLEQSLRALDQRYATLCERLHAARTAAVDAFSEAVQASLRTLELERAVFRAELSPAAEGPAGTDTVRYLFSATGAAPVDVAKCASGGEMSRMMLSLKAMMARYSHMPSMVFDEIDTGVSGSAADKMGSMICRMGEDMQVFAITHLPQVAAKGDAHFLVSKEVAPDGTAVTSITRIGGEARVQELARMLSGSTVTPEAVANARALLTVAK